MAQLWQALVYWMLSLCGAAPLDVGLMFPLVGGPGPASVIREAEGFLYGIKIAQNDALTDTRFSALHAAGLVPVLHYGDSACNARHAVTSLIKLIKNVSTLRGIIGGSCSGASGPMHLNAQAHSLPQVTPAASSTTLSNPKNYPFFARTVYTFLAASRVAATITGAFGWKKAVMLAQADDRGASQAQEYIAEAQRIGITVASYLSIPPGSTSKQIEVQLVTAQRSGVRIIVTAYHKSMMENTMAAARAVGTVGKGWVWLYNEGSLPSAAMVAGGMDAKYLQSLQGTLSYNVQQCVGAPCNDFKTKWTAIVKGTDYEINTVPTRFATFAYDALYTMLLGFNEAVKDGIPVTDGPKVFEKILKLDFTGVSGQVFFDASGDRNGFNWEILNFNTANAQEVVGTVDAQSKSTVDLTKVYWPAGESNVPQDYVLTCPPGQYFGNTSSCVNCDKGRYNPSSGQTVCPLCGKGTYSMGTGQTACDPCASGSFGPGNGQKCVACQAGTYAPTKGLHTCISSPKGSFVPDAGASSPIKCQAGSIAPMNGSVQCQPCPKGTYQAGRGALSCDNCAPVLAGSTTLNTGTRNANDCVCPAGQYHGGQLHGKNDCMTCGVGYTCDKAGLLLPKISPDYFVKDKKIDQVYLCEPKEACLGAEWGQSVCRKPRIGFLCMECPDGLVLSNDFEQDAAGCVECNSITSIIVVILAPIVVLGLCIGIMYFTHHSPLDESPLVTDVQNCLGQLIMFVQVCNVMFAVRLAYGDPMNSFMDAMIAQLDPDKIFSSVPCVAASLTDPIMVYSMVIISPVILIVVLTCAHLIAKAAFRDMLPRNGLVNIVGEVLVEFYISITLAIFAPFNCYKHPNGETSVLNYPSVICGEGRHGGMVALSVFGIIAFPVAAIIVAVFMTWQFPRAMLKNDIPFLIRGRFLFERWRPDCYWFCNVSLARNFCIAVLPCLVPEDQVDVAVLLMALVLLVAFILLVWLKPRRTPKQNALDGFVSFIQIMLLVFGATSVHGDELQQGLSALCIVMVALVVASVMFFICARAYQVVLKIVTYEVYLSHHSGGGATACRVFHNILIRSVSGKTFYDIDNRQTYGLIFDAVRDSSNVVIAFGSETLCRPWCIASLVCAYKKGTPMHSVILGNPLPGDTVCSGAGGISSLRTFSGKMRDNKKAASFEIDTYRLRGYGLSQEDVQPAIQALTQLEPVFLNFLNEAKLNQSLDDVLGLMGSVKRACSSAQATESLFTGAKKALQMQGQKQVNEASLNLIMCDHSDGDAIASSRLIQSVFWLQKGCWVEDQDLAPADFACAVRAWKPGNAVFIFSQNTLSSFVQLSRVGLLVASQPEMHMVPVVVGASFAFPDEDFLQRLEMGKAVDFGVNPQQKITACAGGQVTLKQMSSGLAHVMSFLISFVDIPGLSGRRLEKSLLDILARATGSGRRRSISGQPPLLTAADLVQQEAPAATIEAPAVEEVTEV